MTVRKCAMMFAVAGTLSVTGLVNTASAGLIVIDDFSTVAAPNPWPVQLNAEGSVTVNENGLGVLGGFRQTTVEAQGIGIPGLDFLQVTVAAGAGLLDFNSTVDTDGFLSLLYDGGGSLNADLSSQGGIQVSFAMFDFAGSAPLPVTLHLFDGSNMAMHTLSLMAPGAQSLFFNFNNFAGVDLTSIQSIQFDFDPAIGADFRISQIVAIPAPAALALLSLGIAAPRRRRD